MKCKVCGEQPATWSWQPFGPDPDGSTFTTMGSHYRGFPVLKVCEFCKRKAKQGQQVDFIYQSNSYTFFDGVIANHTSRSGDDLPVRKSDLIGHKFEQDASIVKIEPDGTLVLVHVQGWLDDGRCILFNGEVPIPLRDFQWIER